MPTTFVNKRATKEQAIDAMRRTMKGYKREKPTRVAYMGDGRGFAASNLIVEDDQQLVYARHSLESKQFFVVKNSVVTPEFNKPVRLGYLDHDPMVEQVIAVEDTGFKYQGSAASAVSGGTAPHAKKHQWGGADTVFVDSRQFLPGLVTPTNPPSMTVEILGFTYYYRAWGMYPGETSSDFTTYLPVTLQNRFVLISFDPSTETISYTPGEEFDSGFGGAIGEIGHMPDVPGDSMPLAAIQLTQGTAEIDWNRFGTNNIVDARMFLVPSLKEILSRLEALEEATAVETGNDPQVPVLM